MILIRIITAVVALALGGSITACSRADRQPTGPPEKVTLAIAATLDTALAQVAQVKGLYQQEGLEVTPLKYEYGKPALEAMLEGKADVATVAETPVMFAIMKGADVSIIATIQRSNSNNAVIARKDRGIRTPQDLKGRRIATTSGTIIDFYLDSFLATNGLPRKAVIRVDMKPEQMVGAIGKGDVDAISGWGHVAVKAQKQLGDKGITFLDKDIYTQNYLVVATRDFIRKNPKKVEKFLRALVRADEYVAGHPAESQALIADFCGMDKTVIAGMWDRSDFSVTLEQPLLLALEDESRWAIGNGFATARKIPNYLDYIYLDGLAKVKPKAVEILR